MFVDAQANYAPITPEQLLERPLEPGVAYAIDPDGTDEVDDAISVNTEPARNGKLSTHVTTYIADTAIFDAESEPFAIAKDRLFSDYHESHTDHMLPAEVLGHLSLDNGIEQGAPAIAVRTRIHSGKTALVGIERVRVKVNAVICERFSADEHDQTRCALVVAPAAGPQRIGEDRDALWIGGVVCDAAVRATGKGASAIEFEPDVLGRVIRDRITVAVQELDGQGCASILQALAQTTGQAENADRIGTGRAFDVDDEPLTAGSRGAQEQDRQDRKGDEFHGKSPC